MELKAMAEARKVFLKTFGCQMNVYDSERMSEALAADGYAETGDIADADLVILNTCHIREKAAEKVYSDLGRIRDLKEERKRQGRDTLIAVAGCVAQAEGAEIVRRAPAVDLVVGPQSYHRLPGLLAEAARGRSIVETSFPGDQKFAELEPRRRVRAPSAFLTVQEGCDKFCTFCVVPYTRGAEYSRPVAEVVAEARRLAEGGAREITLLGQNVNAYHGRDETGAEVSLATLISRLAAIEDLRRIRYMTSHPHNMTADLVAAHGQEPKLMPYLHLPFQSGSDRILAAMNRRHTADHYRAIIADVRRARPDIALSTDIIVGFPGETDADFAATMALVEEIGFAQSYSFKYSSRPGTPAAELDGEVPDEVASRRLLELQAILLAQQSAFNAAAVGRTLPVLFERTGRDPGHLVGRTPHQQLVHAEAGPACLGTVEPVAITAHSSNSLQGRLVRG